MLPELTQEEPFLEVEAKKPYWDQPCTHSLSEATFKPQNSCPSLNLPCGCKYYGSILNGLPDGQGTMEYNNKSSYQGQFTRGERSCRGKFCSPSGNLNYDGKWERDQPTLGLFTVKINPEVLDKFRLKAQLLEHRPMLKFWEQVPPSFHEAYKRGYYQYLGEFDSFERHGHGQVIQFDGTYYDGNFLEDQKHGKGTLITLNALYQAEWRNDELEGAATIMWSSSIRYMGKFEHGLPTGLGLFYEKNELSNINWDKIPPESWPGSFEDPISIKKLTIGNNDIQESSHEPKLGGSWLENLVEPCKCEVHEMP